MVNFEDMTKDKLDTEKISDAENEKLKTPEEAESSVEFAEKVLDDVDEETARVLDMGGETLETTQGLDSNDPERGKVENETREVADEAAENMDETKEGIDETVGSESDRRIKDWERMDDDLKKEEIEKYKEGLKGDAEAILAKGESIEECIEKLRKETEEFAIERAAAAMKIREQLNGADSKLGGIEQGEAREMIRELAKNAKDNLNVAKLDYLLRTEEDLMSTHKDKEITIENLEEMADDLESLENFLIELEGLSEGMKIEAKEEVKSFVKKLKEFCDKHPEIIYVLAAAGVFMAAAFLLSAIGEAVPAWLTKELITVGAAVGVSAIGTGALGAYLCKEHGERLKEYGKIAAGGVIGAGILGLGWLLNKEKWEKFMKGASKADYPDWYHFMKELFGLKEDETSKS